MSARDVRGVPAEAGFAFAELANGWRVGRFAALEAMGGVRHAVTTRRGPSIPPDDAGRAAAAGQIAQLLGLEAAAFCQQVHAATVLRVEEGGLAGEADGLVTDRPGLGVLGLSADCPLILAADAAGPGVGMAHASWRGTVRQIAAGLVGRLASDLGARPANVVACVCPSAGPCCYEVGPDVVEAALSGIGPYADGFFVRRGGRTFFDLWAANRDQLLRAGLPAANIHLAGICTICHHDLLPSYRAEGPAAGRFAAIIGRASRCEATARS